MKADQLKILAIDDIQDNLTTLKAIIGDAFPRARVLTTLNGIEGIMLAQAEDPDVILLDIVMPDLDGYEVCRRMKTDQRLQHIPIIFLTARQTDRGSRIKALEAGGEAFLSKPIEEAELIAQIRAMVKIKTATVLQRQENERLAALVAKRTSELEQELVERKKSEEERIRLEQQFQQAQKLESLGVLAGGIAHDFNNILTIILGHCYMANDGTDSELGHKHHVQQIEIAANRAAELCHQMLAYAGKSSLVQTRVNMRFLVDDIVKMLKSAILKNITIELDLQRNVPEITADISQVQQVIMNLIINAADAIGDKNGTIKVVLTKMLLQDQQTDKDFLGFAIRSGNYACLEVTDTGCGMDPVTQKKIFEPFFTTKFAGRGLGMSAILGIIKSHEGALQLSSELGSGTTFKVYFPLSTTSDAIKSQPAASSIPPVKGNGTILLVDDEEALLMIGSALLDAMGYATITACNGREALEIFDQRRQEIDLVLLDLIMPEMGGIEAYRELRKVSPDLPIIICSGYSVEGVAEDIDNDSRTSGIQKPYNPEQLREALVRMAV